MMRPGSSLVAHPGFGVLVVAIGTLVVPFDLVGQFRLPLHHPRIRPANTGDPVGRHFIHVDLRRADAGVRSCWRSAGVPPHLSRRQPLERDRFRPVCDGAELRCVACRARAARRRRRDGPELRAGARDQPLCRDRAHADPRCLYDGHWPRRCARPADRRTAGAVDRLARGILVSRPIRIVGLPAGLATPARHAPGAARDIRCHWGVCCWYWRSARCCLR